MTHDLVAWLTQQLDAREALARAAAAEYPGDTGLHWEAGNGSVTPTNPADNKPVADTAGWGALGDATAQHIADNDPDHVLTAVDATRRILDDLATRRLDPAEPDGGWAATDAETDGMASSVVRLLALPYAHQPGYREEWRPPVMSSRNLPDRIHLPGDTAQELAARIRDRIRTAPCEHTNRTETTTIGVADLTFLCNDCGTDFSEPRPQ